MYSDATYHGKDDGGNFIYVPKWVENLFSDNRGAEPTSCVVDPLHEGLSLWAEAPIEIDGYRIRAYYYLTEEDEQNLDFFDWEEKAEFEVEETFW